MSFYSNIFGIFAQPIFLVIIFINFYLYKFIFNDIFSISLYCIAMLRVIPSASSLITFTTEIKSKMPSLLSVEEFIKTLNKNKSYHFSGNSSKNNSEIKIDKINRIELQNLKFGHTDKLIFDKVNFSIEIGDFIGIQGRSGIGKSTLFELLMGFNLNYNGKILVNDLDLKSINLSSYYEHFAYISQDKLFFDDTIYENIVYGLQNKPTKSEILNLFEKFDLSKIFYEKNFLDNKIFKNGLNLSGGQKQTIDILRGLIRDKNIFLFDESTNALDKKTELQIINMIYGLVKIGKTVLIISHDNSILDQCFKKYTIYNQNINTYYIDDEKS